MDDFYRVILLLVNGPGAVLIFCLLTAKGRLRAANRMLAGLILVVCYFCSVKALVGLGEWRYIPSLVAIPLPTAFLVGPLLCFYLSGILAPGERPRWPRWLHFVPAVLCWAVLVPTKLGGREAIETFFRSELFSFRWGLALVAGISWALYLLRARQLLARGVARLEQRFSTLEGFRLEWLQRLVFAFTVLWTGLVVMLVPKLDVWGEVALIAAGTWVLYGLAIHALKRSAILADAAEGPAPEETRPRYTTSGLSEASAREKGQELLAYLDSSKLYRKSTLTLDDLARAMKCGEYQLSQILNAGLDESFYSLVNRLRIRDAQASLADPGDERPILDIAYDVGYNSKSAFNRAFKAIAGTTPSRFRDEARALSPSRQTMG